MRDVERLPASDYVCAGFPCVAFSRAGLQRGTKDSRGTQLFDETVRLLRTSPPRIGVVLENVPRLLTWDNGSAHSKPTAPSGRLQGYRFPFLAVG